MRQTRFNPTVIRHLVIKDFMGIVIAGLSDDDTYFQVYSEDTGALVYSMPWNNSEQAIVDYLEWAHAQDSMDTLDLAPKLHPFSYAAPLMKNDAEEIK